jgi:hypothetical protein
MKIKTESDSERASEEERERKRERESGDCRQLVRACVRARVKRVRHDGMQASTCANTFAGALSGPHSRDYDALLGHGMLLLEMCVHTHFAPCFLFTRSFLPRATLTISR